MAQEKQSRVDATKAAAEHYAAAADQLTAKPWPSATLESTFAAARQRGEASEHVHGKDYLKTEAAAIRREAAELKDDAGAKKLGERMQAFDKKLTATAEHVGDKNLDKGVNRYLADLGNTADKGKTILAGLDKQTAPTHAAPTGKFKYEHRAVEGATEVAKAMSTSEKLSKEDRTKYAELGKKLEAASGTIHDKASAKEAHKLAQAAMKEMAPAMKQAADKSAEIGKGKSEFASAQQHFNHNDKLAKLKTTVETARATDSKAQATVKDLGAKVAEAEKPAMASKVEARQAAEELAKAKAGQDSANVQIGKLQAVRDGTEKTFNEAQAKYDALKKENQDSVFGGHLSGSKAKEEAALAELDKAKDAHRAAELKLADAKDKAGPLPNQVAEAQAKFDAKAEASSLANKHLSGMQAELDKATKVAEGSRKSLEDGAAALTKAGGKVPKDLALEMAAKPTAREASNSAEAVRVATDAHTMSSGKAESKAVNAVVREAVPEKASLWKAMEPNQRLNAEGVTPLMLAAREGNAAVVKEMVARGGDVNAKTNDGRSAKDFAPGNKEVEAALRTSERAGSSKSLEEVQPTSGRASTKSIVEAGHRTLGMADSKAPESQLNRFVTVVHAEPTKAPEPVKTAPVREIGERSM